MYFNIFQPFFPTLFILAGNYDMHGSLEKSEIRPDLTTDCGVSCPLESEKKSPYTYNGENGVAIFSSAILDQIIFILACNDDIHKSLDVLEIWLARSGTTEVAALEHLTNRCCPFFSFHSCGYT